MTWADRGETDLCPVGAESVTAGVILARWFAQESRRVYAVLSESEEQRDIRRLVEFIRSRGDKITVRELQRANGRKFPDAAAAEAALESLVQAGLGRWVEPDGTHRARVMELCPTPDTSDTCAEAAETEPATMSDAMSDRNGQTPIFSGENDQVSDCRTGNHASLLGTL